MNLFELFVKIGVDDQASGKLSKLTGSLGKELVIAAKLGAAAVGAAATGISFLTKQSVQSYAEFEQLIGGAELMFGDAYQTVMKNAQNAYKTVQMSQNEYLQQVNGFATGLKTALGGNEQDAADLAHRIIQAEADIIAATGNTAENVQNAFNGIMKSNFTMLDNLQIGITPTKEGFQEVIDKVNDWNKANGEATKYQMGNLADMQSALVDYIEMQGISGYAAREASETISGSAASMKSAWSNLITGMADDNANLEKLINNLIDSITGYVDESGNEVKGFADNILPVIEQSLNGIATLIEKLAPEISNALPSLLESLLPSVINAATGLVTSFTTVLPSLLQTIIDSLIENAPLLLEAALSLSVQLTNGLLSALPQLLQVGMELLVSLANGIAQSIPELIPTLVDVIVQIVETLTNPDTLGQLMDAALAIIMALSESLLNPDTINQLVEAVVGIVNNLVTFLMENLDPLLTAAIQIIMALVNYLISPEGLSTLVSAAVEIVIALAGALVGAVGTLIDAAGQLIAELFTAFTETDWGEIGRNILDGIKVGIQNAWQNLKEWFSGLFDDLINIAKKILGIASPSKVFKKIGGFTAEGFGIGFDDEFENVKDDMEKAMSFDDASIGINASIRKMGGAAGLGAFGGVSFGDVIIEVNGDRYRDEEALAEHLAVQLQRLVDREAAAHA